MTIEDARQKFNLMLRDAKDESDRKGSFSTDDVLAEVDDIIARAQPGSGSARSVGGELKEALKK